MVQTILGCPYYDWKGYLLSQPAGSQHRSSRGSLVNRTTVGRAWTERPSSVNATALQGDANWTMGSWEEPLACLTVVSVNIVPNITAGREIFGKTKVYPKKGRRKKKKEDNFGKDSKKTVSMAVNSNFIGLGRIMLSLRLFSSTRPDWSTCTLQYKERGEAIPLQEGRLQHGFNPQWINKSLAQSDSLEHRLWAETLQSCGTLRNWKSLLVLVPVSLLNRMQVASPALSPLTFLPATLPSCTCLWSTECGLQEGALQN